MAGKTKTLSNFQEGINKDFEVSSSLDNVFITNTHTIDILVTMQVNITDYDLANILSEAIIPPGVTLNVLENQPLRLQNTRSSIRYTCADNADDKMDVIYTAQ